MPIYEQLADLPLTIDRITLDRHVMETSSDFTRVTTRISLVGDGEVGAGEDVTYADEHHERLLAEGPAFDPKGHYSLDEFSRAVGATDLFPDDAPEQAAFRNYRRWGFESAALDLALKQAGTDLASRLDRQYRPLRFLVSTRLGDPPSITTVETWLEYYPELEFKLDPTADWTPSLSRNLAATDAVRILDFKGQYEGTTVDGTADPSLYRRLIDEFPNAIIEDPAITDETRAVFDGHESRISWDYPITDIDSVRQVPVRGDWINIKPSRFGSVERLFETIEWCLDEGFHLYGGGQFELDVGRQHLHAIASLFYPAGPNDIAPSPFNAQRPTPGLPTSPLEPPVDPTGLSWRSPSTTDA